jgi:hypothetical protein
MLVRGGLAGRGIRLLSRLRGPLVAGVVLICAACTTFDTNNEDVVTFVFTQPTTECEVFVGNTSYGHVSISKSAIGIPRGNEPMRISCLAASFAPVSAEVSIVRTRDQKVDVLGVGVPTPQALGARVVEPIERVTGPSPIRNPLPSGEKSGYPPRVTVDIAQRAVLVPPGWQTRM